MKRINSFTRRFGVSNPHELSRRIGYRGGVRL